jgi:hypothetical protein
MGVNIENKRMAKSCQTVGRTSLRAAQRVFAGKLPSVADILRNRNPALRSVPAMTNPTEVPEGPNLAITKIIRPPVILRSATGQRSLKILRIAASGHLSDVASA